MLDFAPPLDPAIEPYELQISGARIDTEREAIADYFGPNTEFAESGGLLMQAFRNPKLSDVYTGAAPLVERLMSVELDTKMPTGPGIGESLGGGTPKPRFGAKFGKSLAKPGARTSIGMAFEKMILTGFLGNLVAGKVLMRPERSVGTTRSDTQKYDEWTKFFPGLAQQIFVKDSGLMGGSTGDASVQMYAATMTPPSREYEDVCKQFGVRGRLGLTDGDRGSFTYYCYSAGWLLGHVHSESPNHMDEKTFPRL